ncbi:MAG: uroporphyrinogen-III synthase [Magnetococcales bacterium]|nr:uroporphyrinogen-III synthase [Magnetococcales bacterium]
MNTPEAINPHCADLKPGSNLAGRLLLITRPLPEARTTARQLERLGATARVSPVLHLQPPDDPAPFREALAHLTRYDGIIFTSAHAVRAFLDDPVAKTPLPRIYAVGNKTASLLIAAGLTPEVPDRPLGGHELALELLQTHPSDRRFLFLRAQEGRDELITTLRQAGKAVDLVAAYAMAPTPHLDPETLHLLEQRRIDAIPFFSGRTAQVFFNLLPDDTRHALLDKPLLAALSVTTARAMETAGMRVDLICHQPGTEAMIATLEEAFRLS